MMLKSLIVKWVKNNFASLVEKFVGGIDWATLCAKAFGWLLERAMESGSYERVRRVAAYVAEQTLVVLQVTEDGRVDPGECRRAADLLEAWWQRKGREATQALQDSLAGGEA